MRDSLAATVKAALTAHPEQRLGQLIHNALGRDVDLFNVYDEELEARLWVSINGE